jgi:uncharacterized protein (TIGR00255 family)
MAMLSMTAFVSSVTKHGRLTWTWDIRSVNNRFLDVQLRLPDLLKSHEFHCRDLIRQACHRGKLDVSLKLERSASETNPCLNTDKLFHLATLLEEVSKVIPHTSAVDPLAVLALPNILETDVGVNLTEEEARIIFDSLPLALERFMTEKAREGSALQSVLQKRTESALTQVRQLQAQLESLMAEHIAQLKQKIQLIAPELEASRWAQEVAIIAQRVDISEELDRLTIHLNDVLHLLNSSEPTGRKLDFLMQELNREANTLGSKSMAVAVTQTSLALKILIEQMREQIQNVE